MALSITHELSHLPREATAAVPEAREVPPRGTIPERQAQHIHKGQIHPQVMDSSGHSSCGQYLLSLEDTLQRGNLTGLVSPEHLAQGAGRHLARETVDVDFLVFVLLAHRVAAFLQGPAEVEENRRSGLSRVPCPVPAPSPGSHPPVGGLPVGSGCSKQSPFD